jgi:hypothetical protein
MWVTKTGCDCGCHEGCSWAMNIEGSIEMLELEKKMLHVRLKSIDKKIAMLKERETEAGN